MEEAADDQERRRSRIQHRPALVPPPLISTIAPTPGQRRLALVAAGLAVVAFLLVAPFAQIQLEQIWAFLPIYESAFVTLSLIIVSLLLFQFRMVRSWGLLVLAGGFLFSAAMACVHALSFPGLFAPTGLLGAGPQSTAWIFFLWHGGFAPFVAGYALLRDRPCRASMSTALAATLVFVLAVVSALTLLATAGHDFLPAIMTGHRDAPAKLAVAAGTWAMSILALGLLWRVRPHTHLDLWLMVLLGVWIFDSAVSGVINHARFDVGWYLGRVFGLLGEALALIVLLMENNTLYLHLVSLRAQENRRSAEQLEEEEKRFEATFEQAAMGLALVSPDGRWLRVNRKLCEIVGYDADELMVLNFQDITHPDDLDADIEGVRKMLAGEIQTYSLEKRYIHKQGNTVWINLTVALVAKPDGRPDYFVSVIEDITQRYRTEIALRKSEERFRTYVEESPLGIFVADSDGRFVDVNPAAEAMLGWNRDEICARQLGDVVSSEDLVRLYADFAILTGSVGRIAGEYRFVAALGSVVWVSLAAVRIASNRFAAFCQDITARKAIEGELERYRKGLERLVAERTADLESAEARQRLILESTADGIYGVDVDGRITFVNPGVGVLLGWRPEQLIGRTSLEMLHHSYPDGTPFPKEACPLFETLRTGIVHRFDDEYFWAANGQPIPVSFSTHPMVHDGRIIGAVVSFNDISVRKAADVAREAALAEAERLANLRREFLANMSHEIRTPLSAIVGLAQIGERDCGEAGGREKFSRILDAGHGLQQVVDDILDFSKIESGKMTVEAIPMEIGMVVDRAIDLLALRAWDKGLRVEAHEEPDLPLRCLGDPNRLCQVLINLLSNAIKFTRAGGTVTLRVARAQNRLVLSVSDTGIGIAPEVAGRLFRPFEQADGSTTRRFGGTGLGLSISRNLVDLMGGSIAFDSVPGQGSTFTVTLPLTECDPAPLWPQAEVALLGLPEAEADQALYTLPRCRRVAAADVLSGTDASLVLIDRSVLADPALAGAVRARLDRGGAVAVLIQPGEIGTVAAIPPGAVVIERPFRPRHLRRLLSDSSLRADAAIEAVSRLSGLRVLGAEDNEVNRLVLDDMLQIEGATLTCFENGRLALDHLREVGAEAFDLVLTDVQMPELDGYGLAQEVARFAPGLPVIGLTAHAMDEERVRCLAAGMVDRVVKPISPEALVATILHHGIVAKRGGTRNREASARIVSG